MREWLKHGIGMFMLVGILILTGCQAASDVPEVTKEAAESMETSKEDDGDVEPLQEENDVPNDGIITAKQMATIAGKEGTYYFNGESSEGIHYRWEYNGNKIKNPEEQALKVEFVTEGVDKVQEAANDAPYGLGFELQKMNMASPATLIITLTEKWDADKVLFCTRQDGKIYQFGEAKIETVESVSQISFQVTKAGGTFYLLGGSAEADDAKKSSQGDKSQTNSSQANDNAQDADTDEDINSDGDDNGNSSTETNGNGNTGSSSARTCTISIECSTILNNWDDLTKTKAEFVPSNGWILEASEVEFFTGETVFDVLKRVCNDAGIHMSSRYTPMYGSYYIEGINQLYEFDCGANSGWMYRVNGWYPNYGCSSYTLEAGDNIEWRYTCDLGSDVGGGY